MVSLISLLSVLTCVATLRAELPQDVAKHSKTKTVWDGVYTAEQSARGKAVFLESCSSCHGTDLLGGVSGAGSSGGGNAPGLAGERFIERWREDDLVQLFTLIRSSMPRSAAGTVSDTAKLDAFAFLLQTNKFPAGKEELSLTALETIRIVGKDGPKPLPSTTPVRTVGCLTRGAGNAWTLSYAAEPVRAHRPDETNASELSSSEGIPLGSLVFRLPSLDYAVPGVRPTPLQGHKVQIKGIVYRQTNDESISVKSLKSLASSCTP